MFHNFKYDFLRCLRTKEVLFWMILFPIFLGTIFKVAFANISNGNASFSAIDIAVVERIENNTFKTVLDEVSSGDEPLFSITYTDEENALSLLENHDITGIIYVDDNISLTVGSITGTTVNVKKTIIKSFIEQYNFTEQIIIDTVKNEPQKLNLVIEKLSADIKCNETIPLTDGNTDNMLSYFYNLIAMVALLGSNIGIYIAIDNQANLSPIGARVNCSPTKKLHSLTASLISRFLENGICVAITITYLIFVLKIDFGSKIPMVYLAGIISGMVGVSFGFFVGSFGRMSEGTKGAISVAVSLLSCFCSGLMIGNMKAIVDLHAPWFNEINPAAVISDAFYCLNIYNDYERYTEKIITMLIMTVIFSIAGFLLTRRRKYASL